MSDETKDLDKDTDRRSPDQDAAIEQAFVAGALPEEDRRAPEPELAADPIPEVADAGASLYRDNFTTPANPS